jgi:hypothetical protein
VRALLALALLGAAGCGGGPEIVARDRDGGVVAEAALPGSGRFELSYRHSVYEAPALERFRAAGDGSFVLESVSSPSAAVIDYYALDGRRTRERGWWTVRPDTPARFATMALAATRLGRRTLIAGGHRIPLYRTERAVHLRLAVEGT